MKCSVQLLGETFLIQSTEGVMIKNVYWFHVKYPKVCHSVMKLEFSRQIFDVFANIRFHENPCSGSRVVPCEPTDGRTDMTMLIVAFRNFANARRKFVAALIICL